MRHKKATPNRSLRVNDQIQRDVAELIRDLKDPRISNMITITNVEVTPDYAHAKVFFTSMTGETDVPEILRGLNHARGFLRRELGRRIRIHTIPELHFHYDRSVEEGARLSRLIDEVVRDDETRHQGDAEELTGEAKDEGNCPTGDDDSAST